MQTGTLPEGPPPTSRPLPTCPEGGVKAPRDFAAFLHHSSHHSVLFNTRLLPLGYKASTSFTAMASQCLRKVCGRMDEKLDRAQPSHLNRAHSTRRGRFRQLTGSFSSLGPPPLLVLGGSTSHCPQITTSPMLILLTNGVSGRLFSRRTEKPKEA